MAKIRLKMRKDVNILICRILVEMQSSTICHISIFELKTYCVLFSLAKSARRQEYSMFLELYFLLCYFLIINPYV